MKETDLYPPLKTFLEGQGYEVKGEIEDCDVVAVRADEEPVVIELKLTLNLTVILQAIGRLAVTQQVYVGIPPKCSSLRTHRRQILKLFRMLGLGLILIDPTLKQYGVDIILDPKPYTPRKVKSRLNRLLGEFEHRIGDPNQGGASRRSGMMTAYRQRALRLAEFLRQSGPAKAAEIAKLLEEPKARDILYRNVYGWFENVKRGVYTISPRGEKELPLWQRD